LTGPTWRDRLRRRRSPYVVLAILAVVGGLLFLAEDARTIQVRSAYAADHPEFAAYLAALVNAPVVRGGRITALTNGDEIYPAMVAAIDRATRSVSFETYNYLDGRAADRIGAALVSAARRGVKVRVILDTVGASPPPQTLSDDFEAAGAKIVWFHPVSMWTIEATNNRTHRKLLIVDGEIGFTGGAGVADHWLGNARNEDEWRDTHFQITGPLVRSLEACFYENWIEAGGTDAPELPAPGVGPGSGSSVTAFAVWSNPTVGVSNIKLLYLYAIDAARRTIDIQSPYFVLDESVRETLRRATERGVRIRVLTDGDHTDAKSVKHASRNEYAPLLEAGHHVFEYQPTMMHAKAIMIDGRWSIIGSANFDNRSLELNDEITIAVDDASLAETLTRAFDRDLRRSTAWTPATWRDRPWHWKVRERFWGLFGEVF
jgi:cardiolipin synthase